jgi:hypothetical protein
MKMNIKIFFGIALTICLFPACKKNLDLTPISQISNASFWKTESDVKGALYGMYVRLRTQAAINFFLWGEARSEVMDRSLGGTAGFENYYLNQLDRTNVATNYSGGTITWQVMYQVIHDANSLLKYVPPIDFSSQTDKNKVLAQAHATRAFTYFTMVKIWGDLPLVTDPIEGYDPVSSQRERMPKSQVLALIKQDIDDAVTLFDGDYSYPAGRDIWSLPAVYALKADVYLWTGKRESGGDADIQTALDACNEVQKSDATLLSDFASVFDYSNKGNKEIIKAVRFQDLESAPQTMFAYAYMSPSTMTNSTSQATKDAIGNLGGNPFWQPSDLVRNQFSNDDQRKNASFIEIYNYSGSDSTFYASVVSKFSGTVTGGTRLFLDDVILYRYADILLMKAEAENALRQDPSVEINAVRSRAYGDHFSDHIFVSGTTVENDEAILKERLLELIFEGKRWWDLVRFGKAFEKVPSLQGRTGQDDLLLFPISETTLSLETKIVQNPGYQ